jgi:cystathionine beta-lyase/cystathionine gamma-synthase
MDFLHSYKDLSRIAPALQTFDFPVARQSGHICESMGDTRKMMPMKRGDSTRSVHGGRKEGAGPLSPPIVQTSTFAFASHEAMLEAFEARERGAVYTRYTNPTLEECERRLAELEGTEDAWVFGSGMAAITSAVLSQVSAGDRVLAQREVYGGTYEFFAAIAPRLGLTIDWYDVGDEAGFQTGLANKPKLIYIESPTNPLLRCADLEACAAAAKKVGAVTVVDSTFATPLNLRPHAFGIDLVVHSATKYMAGHSDLIAGCVMGDADRLKEVWRYRKLFGGILDPHAAYLLERSLRTLAVRVKQHNRNAEAVAGFLEGQTGVAEVYYPGLASHPDHAIARRQMTGSGGMVTVTLDTDLAGTIRFVEALELFRLAASLGGVESLVSIPATSSHFGLSAEERAATGVPDGMARLSVGIEDAEDLISDLKNALAQARAGSLAGSSAAESR